jgi:hypothetical protein
MSISASFTAPDLHVTAPPERAREPLTCGLPWPFGAVPEGACLTMRDNRGQPVPLQTRFGQGAVGCFTYFIGHLTMKIYINDMSVAQA